MATRRKAKRRGPKQRRTPAQQAASRRNGAGRGRGRRMRRGFGIGAAAATGKAYGVAVRVTTPKKTVTTKVKAKRVERGAVAIGKTRPPRINGNGGAHAIKVNGNGHTTSTGRKR